MTRYPLIVCLLFAGCSSPTAPTPAQPVAVVTPPTVAPPAPPPAPVVTYTGTWQGQYVIERCSGQGTIEDLLCSAPSGSRPGGLFPVGTALGIALQLTQNGSTVTGIIHFGEVTGAVTGVISNGRLTLQGTATNPGGLSLAITAWDSTMSGDQLSGTLTYSASVTNVPGFASVSSRLSNVRR